MISLINRSNLRYSKPTFSRKEFLECFKKLRHISSSSSLSGNDNNKFSDTFHHIFTNTKPISDSVCIASSVAAHTKNSSCWINNRKSHFSFSFISYRNYHKCSRCCISENLINKRSITTDYKKMVWITDLDNPQVKFIEIVLLCCKRSVIINFNAKNQ